MKFISEHYIIKSHILGRFRLDGGAMFGSIPKNIWNNLIAADDTNCIPLACRSLSIQHKDRLFLIELGIGNKFTGKLKEIFKVEEVPLDAWGLPLEKVTDIILTHLHFDHSGGLSSYNGTELVVNFPFATYYIQSDNLENALNPNLRERASYLAENVNPLLDLKTYRLDGSQEIYPGISVHPAHGHTRGLQWVKIKMENQTFVYASDLIPTSHHISLPYVMGYDICAETALKEKKDFLEQAVSEEWIVVFTHDPKIAAGRVGINEKAQYFLKEAIDI